MHHYPQILDGSGYRIVSFRQRGIVVKILSAQRLFSLGFSLFLGLPLVVNGLVKGRGDIMIIALIVHALGKESANAAVLYNQLTSVWRAGMKFYIPIGSMRNFTNALFV